MSEERPVVFNTDIEYRTKRDELYNKIHQIIYNSNIINKYNYMDDYGITLRQQNDIYYELNIALKEFTQNKCDDWCDKTTFYIMSGVEGFLNALVKINKIEEFNAEELAEMIYNSIVYQLYGDNHDSYLLDQVITILEFVEDNN
jgi:hypothetical protein